MPGVDRSIGIELRRAGFGEGYGTRAGLAPADVTFEEHLGVVATAGKRAILGR